MKELVYGRPEEVGVPSGAVLSCLKRLEDRGIPMHSFLLYRKGKVITEVYYAPYEKHMLHRMYSVTKSFASLAVGLLAEQGKLKLDDKIIRYFGEYLPEQVHPWLASMSIRDMLRMETCYAGTTYKKDLTKNWVESFFTTEPDHRPGQIFTYDTSSAHTLCALVEKLAGMPMLDYLKRECLNEIGFSKESYVIQDPFGVSMGGSGMMAKPEDLLKVGILLLDQGVYDGRQIYPAEYIKEAVSLQAETSCSRHNEDERQGYGYQFWRFRHGAYGCYGMGGQMVICFPKEQMVCVTTADAMGIDGGHQQILDAVFECILPRLDQEEGGCDEFERFCGGLSLTGALSGCRKDPDETFAVTAAAVKKGSFFRDIGIRMSGGQGEFYYTCPNGEGRLAFRTDGWTTARFPFYDQLCAVSAGWTDERNLFLKIQIMGEDCCSIRIQFVFGEDSLTAYMQSTGELAFFEFSGFFEGKITS